MEYTHEKKEKVQKNYEGIAIYTENIRFSPHDSLFAHISCTCKHENSLSFAFFS